MTFRKLFFVISMYFQRNILPSDDIRPPVLSPIFKMP